MVSIFPHLGSGDFKIFMACLVHDDAILNFRCQPGREAHREAIATREVEVTARVRRGTDGCENHGEHMWPVHG